MNPATQPLAASPALLPDTSLHSGQYHIERVIGQGGFGIVYRATDITLQRTVAIRELCLPGYQRSGNRLLPPSGIHDDPNMETARELFLEEGRVLAKLTEDANVNIVPVFTSFAENNTAYIVMKFLHGETLAAVVKKQGPLPEDKALHLIEQAGHALSLAHEQELIHCDIQPDNLMLCQDGRLVLINFGLNTRLIRPTQHGTRLLSGVGTPGFTPLEQYPQPSATGRHLEVGAYTDVYALAATLYFLLTGEVPTAATRRESGQQLPQPSNLNPGITRDTSEAVMWGLELYPEQRPQQIEQFLTALSLLEGSGVGPRLPTAPDPPGRRATAGTHPLQNLAFAAAVSLALGFIWTSSRQLTNRLEGAWSRVSPLTWQKTAASSSAAGLLAEAKGHFSANRYDQALAGLQQAEVLSPGNADIYLWRGRCYQEKNQHEQAIAEFTKALRLGGSPADCYHYRGRSHNNKAATLTAPSMEDARQRLYDLAIADLSQSLALRAGDPMVLLRRGVVYANKERYDLAIADFTKARDLDPNNANVYGRRGSALVMKGQLDLAIADYDKALSLCPDSNVEKAQYYKERGWIYHYKRQPDLSLRDYQKALAIKRNDADAYVGMAFAKIDKKLLSAAQSDLEKALVLDPGLADVHSGLGTVCHNKAVRIQGTQRDQLLKLAVDHYQKAISLAPQDDYAYSALATAYRTMNRFDESLTQINKAIDAAPTDGQNYKTRAWTWYFKKNYQEAWKDIGRCRAYGSSPDLDLIAALKKAEAAP